MVAFHIQQCSPEEAFTLSLQIPEFEPWYPWQKWEERLSGKKVIALIAKENGLSAGMKVGYFRDDHFYSWVGGVLPDFRRRGVAEMLADQQEQLVKATGITRIEMKTRNKFRSMLLFAIGRGFQITGVEEKGSLSDWRITLTKNL